MEELLEQTLEQPTAEQTAALEQEFAAGDEGRGKRPAARKENAMEKMRRGAQEAVQPR